MLAKWTLHLIALGVLVVGTGVGVGNDGPVGVPGKHAGTGVKIAVPAGGQQNLADQIAIDPVTGESERLREGTTVRLKGRFDLVGDRATFYTEDGRVSFKTLENLALQRVMVAVRDSTDPRLWNVEATVTEYQGANFLLIRRATVTLGE